MTAPASPASDSGREAARVLAFPVRHSPPIPSPRATIGVPGDFWKSDPVLASSVEATGVWVRAASWCLANDVDIIPANVLRAIVPERGRTTDFLAVELVEVGLWERVGDGFRAVPWIGVGA